MFWTNLPPGGGDKPVGELATAVDDQFGSFDAVRAQFGANRCGAEAVHRLGDNGRSAARGEGVAYCIDVHRQ